MIFALVFIHACLAAYFLKNIFFLVAVPFALVTLRRRLNRGYATALLLFCFFCLVAVVNQVSPDSIGARTLLFFMLADFLTLWAILYQVHFPEHSREYILQMIKNILRMSGIVALVLFMGVTFFPKVSFNLFSAGVTKNAMGFGSGTEMNPGEISNLEQSDEVAFRAILSGDRKVSGNELYWRGSTLTRTIDGMHWLQGSEFFSKPIGSVSSVDQKILLEPRFNDVYFGLDFPISAPRFGIGTSGAYEKTLYLLTSSVDSFPSTFPEGLNHELTHIPKGLDTRFQGLIQSLTTDHPSLPVFANRLTRYYIDHFKKRLDPGTYEKDGMTEFFFKRKEGFCEHFSGTFATLLRMAGFRSRVVMGFRGGEWNPYSKSWVVRDYHAHAWVEAWDPAQNRWLRFDPTAVIGPDVPNQFTSNFLSDYVDALNTRWNYFYHAKENRYVLVGIVLALFILFGTIRLIRKRRERIQKSDQLFLVYDQFCKSLKKWGLERSPQEGPVDFLNRALLELKGNESLRDQIKLFTEVYVRIRYENRDKPDRKDLKRLKLQLRAIKTV